MSNVISDSMAKQLWYHALRSTKSSLDSRTTPPSAFNKAAKDLEKLYLSTGTSAAGFRSLDVLYQRALEQGWSAGQRAFGYWLASRALGDSGTSMMVPGGYRVDDLPSMRGFKIPAFSISFDGDELEWEGDADRRNPTEEDELEYDLGINPRDLKHNPADGELRNIFLEKEDNGWHVNAEYARRTINYGPFATKERGMRMREAVIESSLQHNPTKRNPWLAPSRFSPSQFEPAALRAGTKVEMEHTNDPAVAQQIAMDHLAEDPKYYEKLATIHNPSKPHEILHKKTVAEVRSILARIPKAQRCHDECPAWIVSESDKYGTQVEVCDECMTSLGKALRLTDSEVAQLPEAQRELEKTSAIREKLGAVEMNPAHKWPASSVQSLLFDVDRFSPSAAKKWAADHGFHYGKIHTTERYHRLRQFEPTGKPCRTVEFAPDIKAVVCSVGRSSR